MVRQPNEPLDVQKSVTLKLGEPAVDCKNPWGDDLLARQDIAKRLTSHVEYQEPPLTISIHGQWGTGKTFMLRRWQKDLENQGFRAIYFNSPGRMIFARTHSLRYLVKCPSTSRKENSRH